jgi:hypothetical protein
MTGHLGQHARLQITGWWPVMTVAGERQLVKCAGANHRQLHSPEPLRVDEFLARCHAYTHHFFDDPPNIYMLLTRYRRNYRGEPEPGTHGDDPTNADGA